jgi:hypothetical protein
VMAADNIIVENSPGRASAERSSSRS